MRNPDRIDAILHKIRRVRTAYPDMRFWQLLTAIWYLVEEDNWSSSPSCEDPFHYEDDRLEKCLDKFILENNILDI